MAETISDVVLRLARRHVPADAVAAISPAASEPETVESPLNPMAPLPRDKQGESVDTNIPAASADPRSSAPESAEREPVVADSNQDAFVVQTPEPASYDMPAGRPHEIHEFADRSQDFAVDSGLSFAGSLQFMFR